MPDLTHLIAVALAIGAAISNAIMQLCVRLGTERGKSSHAVLIVMSINMIVLLPIVAIVYYPNYQLTSTSWIAFIGAGLFGTLLGRAFMYTSISKIGASRTAPIVATQALIATLLGVVILDEELTGTHAAGIVLIVIGVGVIAWETSHDNPGNLSQKQLLIGLLIPFGAALAYGAEPIYANYGFEEGTPAPVGLSVKTVAATLGFTLYLRWRKALPDFTTIERGNLRWFVLAGIANTLFLVGYYLGLEIAPVSVIVPIHITSTLFVVILSMIFMPRRLEQVTWQLAAASTVVVVGVVIITATGG
jgi:DME family drug/metabolite transporter